MSVRLSALPLRGRRPGGNRPAEPLHAPRPPLRIEVLAYAPTAFFHCMHCEFVFQQVGIGQKIHAEQNEAAFPEDLQREYVQLSDWAHQLVERHCGRVEVQVVDAASVEGVWKALRYRVRRFPALVLCGRAHPIGNDFAGADALVDRALAEGGDV